MSPDVDVHRSGTVALVDAALLVVDTGADGADTDLQRHRLRDLDESAEVQVLTRPHELVLAFPRYADLDHALVSVEPFGLGDRQERAQSWTSVPFRIRSQGPLVLCSLDGEPLLPLTAGGGAVEGVVRCRLNDPGVDAELQVLLSLWSASGSTADQLGAFEVRRGDDGVVGHAVTEVLRRLLAPSGGAGSGSATVPTSAALPLYAEPDTTSAVVSTLRVDLDVPVGD